MQTFKSRAENLQERAAQIAKMPVFERPKAATDLVGDLSGFLVALSDRVDALTPFADEGAE